jgi:hypothetical protein
LNERAKFVAAIYTTARLIRAGRYFILNICYTANQQIETAAFQLA